MKKNVCGIDRSIRIIIGIALIAYAILAKAPIAYIGILPLLTGLIKFCPLYPFLKINTCAKKD